MATPAAPDQSEKFGHSVRDLTRLSSQGDYVVVDQDAPYILQSATRIRKAQSPFGLFYEVYHSTKSKAKCFFSGPPQSTAAAQVADVEPGGDPYDTSGWDDKQTDEEHYITASHVATRVSRVILNYKQTYN